jgi:hypothetical protein
MYIPVSYINKLSTISKTIHALRSTSTEPYRFQSYHSHPTLTSHNDRLRLPRSSQSKPNAATVFPLTF